MDYHRIFISYKSDDEFFARGIVESLESIGLPCWIASRDIAEGAAFNREIPPAIERAELVVLILTKKADESEEVQREIALATQSKKKILPINVDKCRPINLHYWLTTIQWLTFSDYGGFDPIAEAIASKCLGVIAPTKKRSTITIKASRFIPLYTGSGAEISPSALKSIINDIGLRGSPFIHYFNDGFAVLVIREELSFTDPIELLRDRRRVHLDMIGHKDILSSAMFTGTSVHPLFLDNTPKIEYVMSVHQLLCSEGLRDADIYAICEPSLIGVTDDPNQAVASQNDATASLANIKATVALSQLTPIPTKSSCFYVGWSNVVLVDSEIASPDFQRLEAFEIDLQKLWFQLNAYDVSLDECILSPELYDVAAVKREVNKSKLHLAKFKKTDSVGSAHINALKESLFLTSKIKGIVANIDEKLEML